MSFRAERTGRGWKLVVEPNICGVKAKRAFEAPALMKRTLGIRPYRKLAEIFGLSYSPA